MKIVKCDNDKCLKEFEPLNEYTSEQSVAIKIEIHSERRNFPSGFRVGDFCSTKCAIRWLEILQAHKGY